MKRTITRLAAAGTALALLTAPAAQALTRDQAAELLGALYVDDVPQSVLEQPTIDAMLAALGDPYTIYFTAEEYAAFNDSMSDDSLVGIGILFSLTDKGLLISEVMDHSPALEGGLAPGDLIIEVDGNNVIGQDADTVTGWIQGEIGTQVKIRYRHNGLVRYATLRRDKIMLPATTIEVVDGHIGYIRCTTFGQETVQHFRDALETYADVVTVWIVDLRGNSGGITSAATDSAALFAGKGDMAYLRNGYDEYSSYSNDNDPLSMYPTIVLMDQNAASSSELFAGAIRDSQAGIVIGTRSFGKGLAQTVLDQQYLPEYFPDGDAIKITSHRFFTPHGNSPDQIGIIPDLLLDADMTEPVAFLLAGKAPKGDCAGLLRLDLRWQWYISPEDVKADPGAFTALLNAIPTGVSLWEGYSGPDNWRAIAPEDAAKRYKVSYTPPLFPDHSSALYGDELSVMKTYGLVHGREDGLFYPQDPLTRAELCQLISSALHCEIPKNSSPYPDVPYDAWYAPAVTAMTNMGLVMGMDDGTFHPQDVVDHQQLITIAARLAKRFNLFLYDDAKAMPEDIMELPELEAYSDWAKSSVWLLGMSQLNRMGAPITLLWERPKKVDPTADTTREEAAYLLHSVLSYMDILPA